MAIADADTMPEIATTNPTDVASQPALKPASTYAASPELTGYRVDSSAYENAVKATTMAEIKNDIGA